jgi:dCTP deaminase
MQPDQNGSYVLRPRKTYVFKLRERLARTGELRNGDFHGQATAKSSVGRLDVLARLIVDGADIYEGFSPNFLEKSTGELFLEITPMTFPVRVRKEYSLTQLRFFRGSPEIAEIDGTTVSNILLRNSDGHVGALRVNLKNTTIAGQNAVAFCVHRDEESNNKPPVDLSTEAEALPDPSQYWKIVAADEGNRLQIRAGSFYIIRSKELITVPKGIAVYCRAIDESIGEMRIHYAGFVHPFFGTGRQDSQDGAPLIFEVRGHDVDVSLVDGEKMAKLIFYRLSEDAEQKEKSAYSDQDLKLSKYFAKWPG